MLHNTPKSTRNIDHNRDIYNPLYTIGKDFIELISKVFVRAFCKTEHYVYTVYGAHTWKLDMI
jgi:hypothetical protein